MLALLRPLAALTPLAAQGVRQAEALLTRCDAAGRLGADERDAAHALVGAIEQALA